MATVNTAKEEFSSIKQKRWKTCHQGLVTSEDWMFLNVYVRQANTERKNKSKLSIRLFFKSAGKELEP